MGLRTHAEVAALGGHAGFGREDEGFADGGVLGPFRELLKLFFGGLLAVAFEASFLDFDIAGLDITTAQFHDVLKLGA